MIRQPDLGKKLFELRMKQGMTQSELAEASKVSLRTVQRIESTDVSPRSHTLKELLKVLKSDYETFTSAETQGVFPESGPLIQKNKKLSIMTKVTIISILTFIVSSFIINKTQLNGQKIDGWFLAGSDPDSYDINVDKDTFYSGTASASLNSNKEKIDGFGTLMQSCGAADFLGKKVKMSAFIKTENVELKCAMWFRVDSREKKGMPLSFDNMSDRPIRGTTEWAKYEIILDVPENSGTLNYGILIGGKGKAWIDDIKFEVVDDSTKTSRENIYNKKPKNLDFG